MAQNKGKQKVEEVDTGILDVSVNLKPKNVLHLQALPLVLSIFSVVSSYVVQCSTQDIPTPITTFDMRKPKKFAKRYKKCVEDIRAAMDKDTTVKFTFVMAGGNEVVVPVPPDDKTRQGTYVIRLIDGTKNLDLVADKYQSWFRGITTGNT